MKTVLLAGAMSILGQVVPSVAAVREDYLASLIIDSHSVVLAERGPQRPLKNWAAATCYVIKKVYRGSLLPGQRIEVFERVRVDPGKGLPADSLGKQILPIDPEAILLAVVAASGNGQSDRRSRAVESGVSVGKLSWWSSSNGLAGGSFSVEFDPPLPPGRYRMWIEARLGEEEGQPGGRVLRTDPQEVQFGK